MGFNTTYLFKNTKLDVNESSIYYFCNYFRWSEVKDLNEDDIKRANTLRILDFKDGSKEFYPFFKRCFINHLEELKDENWIVCSIPDHDQTLPLPNHMDDFLAYCNLPKNFLVIPSMIRRNKIMPQKHGDEYGERTIKKDLDSYKVRNGLDLTGKNIIVFDDIVTSGCSLIAARIFLQNLGANKVVCIALGKTFGYEQY